MNYPRFFLLIAAVFIFLSFQVALKTNPKVTAEKEIPAFLQSEEKWVDSVFASLSPDERLGQLFMIPCWSNKDARHVRQIREVIQKYKIGGLIFMQGDRKSTRLNSSHSQQSRMPSSA